LRGRAGQVIGGGGVVALLLGGFEWLWLRHRELVGAGGRFGL
jgi:hypothetical protein